MPPVQLLGPEEPSSPSSVGVPGCTGRRLNSDRRGRRAEEEEEVEREMEEERDGRRPEAGGGKREQ